MVLLNSIMKRKNIFIILAILVFFIVLIFSGAVKLITDWFWFEQIGFGNIFTTILSTKILLGFIAGLISFGLIYLNLRLASHFTRGKDILIRTDQQGTTVDIGKYLNKFILYLGVGLGFFTGLTIASSWETVLKYLNSTSFNVLDPIFGRDISFYFFDLPFLKILLGFLFWIVIVSLIGSILIYVSRKALIFFSKKVNTVKYSIQGKPIKYQMEKNPKIHIFLLIAFIFILWAVRTYLIKIPSLVYSTTGQFTGASYADIYGILPILKILIVVLLIGAVISIFSIFRKNSQALLWVIGIYLVISILGIWIYPAVLQRFVVEPNELNKETPYIKNNIKATQKAFKLDEIEEQKLSGESSLTLEDIKNNQTTIKNIRLWDREPLLDTFGQIQEIRTYYDFVSIDNDRYTIDGDYRQVLLSSRELNSESLPHKSFINEHLTFTHGFGLTLGPVNEVTEEGLPLLFIKDLPPVSITQSLKITRPEIYYGELTESYVFVKTKAKEFDYPSGEKNVFSNYQGDGGVPVKSLFRKALFAIRFGDSKVLFSDNITSESRAMYYRNIKERVQKVLPFLKLDEDPYIVITKDGKLKWIYDGYTVSSDYPYSQIIGSSITSKGINYIRNSVKIIIDAYDGSMKFYIAEPEDPLIQTYAKIFENTFLPLEEMSSDLKEHIRYPEDMFSYQVALYTVYHMEEPQIFYNKEDQWEIPRISEGRIDSMVRHIIMKLPGEEKEEYILMIPYTPQGKDNLSAWMVARSDGENYGKLAIYRFPKQRLIFGPKQIINRINQDPDISGQISLWDQRGSQVNQGPLLVIPIEESLLYVRPLYLRAEGGKIPELKRVIVAYEKQIVMETSLDKALNKIFIGGGEEEKSEEREIPVKTSQEKTIVEQAKEYLNKAVEAQRSGNWNLYGQEIKKLEEILNQYLIEN